MQKPQFRETTIKELNIINTNSENGDHLLIKVAGTCVHSRYNLLKC